MLPISHDEVVHGKGSLLRKMPGDRWQQLANLRAYLAFMWAHPGKQLMFMGTEFGQESEWAEARELDWWLLEHPEHAGVHALVRDLNRVYAESPALWPRDDDPGSFEWIDAERRAAQRLLVRPARARRRPDLGALCVANFAAVPHGNFHLGLPPPAPGRRSSTPTRPATPARESATSARSAVEATGPASRRTPTSRCRPWPRSGCGTSLT